MDKIREKLKNFQPSSTSDDLSIWHGTFISKTKWARAVTHPPPSSCTRLSCSLSTQRVSLHPSASLTFPLTWASVALVASVRDLRGQVQVVLPLLRRSVISPDADHAPREAGQVAHLVIQDPSPPLCHVGETTRWLLYQVSFNRLQQHTRSETLKPDLCTVHYLLTHNCDSLVQITSKDTMINMIRNLHLSPVVLLLCLPLTSFTSCTQKFKLQQQSCAVQSHLYKSAQALMYPNILKGKRERKYSTQKVMYKTWEVSVPDICKDSLFRLPLTDMFWRPLPLSA